MLCTALMLLCVCFKFIFKFKKWVFFAPSQKIAIQNSPIFRIEHQKVHPSLIEIMQETFAWRRFMCVRLNHRCDVCECVFVQMCMVCVVCPSVPWFCSVYHIFTHCNCNCSSATYSQNSLSLAVAAMNNAFDWILVSIFHVIFHSILEDIVFDSLSIVQWRYRSLRRQTRAHHAHHNLHQRWIVILLYL